MTKIYGVTHLEYLVSPSTIPTVKDVVVKCQWCKQCRHCGGAIE